MIFYLKIIVISVIYVTVLEKPMNYQGANEDAVEMVWNDAINYLQKSNAYPLRRQGTEEIK